MHSRKRDTYFATAFCKHRKAIPLTLFIFESSKLPRAKGFLRNHSLKEESRGRMKIGEGKGRILLGMSERDKP